MTLPLGSLRGAVCLLAASLLSAADAFGATWTVNSLPTLPVDFASYRLEQMSDGRLLYGTSDSLSRQTSFGGAFSLQSFSGTPTWDPSAVSLFSDSLGAVGEGTFGPSSIYLFNPSNLAGAFSAIPGVSLQNYSLVFRNGTSLYVGGNNGTGGRHSISYVTTDGSVNKVIIDSISDYSGDFAIDLAGNLYVSDNDDLKLYKFSASQLAAAIAGSPLAITDGQFLTTLNKNGSLAVDGLGRIWSSGYQSNGIDLYDPASGFSTTLVPGLANTNYVVQTFEVGGESYVSYLNAGGYGAGSSVSYGYTKASNVVPEPSSGVLLLAAGAGLLGRRRRRP